MGQEPNIRVGMEALPRATAKPGVPGGWVPRRPGEVTSPADMPSGGAFGRPGPDMGFAIRLVRARELPEAGARADVEAAVLAVVMARASATGRAPTGRDIDVAIDLLDLAESDVAPGLARDSAARDALVGSIPLDGLTRQ